MIKFRKIRFKNFLSYGNNFTEIQLDKTHTTLLLGDSGSGKSSLLDALTFALFNRPFRSIQKKNLVNSINKKRCFVEIEFEIGSKYYVVKRGIAPNIFEIWCDGVLINQDANARDYQSYLETEILKFNVKAFKQIVVLGAAGFTPFMQLKPQDRRIIIESLLDIEIFSLMNMLLKQKICDIKSRIEEVEFDIEILKEKIKLHEDYINKLDASRDNKIQSNMEKIESNKKQIVELDLEIKDLKKQIGGLSDECSFRSESEKHLHRLFDEEKKILREAKDIKNKIKFLMNNDECPTCYQYISENFKEEQIQKKNKILGNFGVRIRKIKEDMGIRNKEIEKADQIQKEIEELNSQIIKSQNVILGIKKYIKEVAKETLELKKPKKESKEHKEKLNEMNSDISKHLNRIEDLKINKTVYDIASSMLKDGGIKARIIKQYIPLINKFTNKFLTHMDFFVTFVMDEEFKEAIKSRGRDDFTYECFSEGEKQRMDLALLFTWRAIARLKNSVHTNLLVMDEVFDSYLDNDATENVIALLNSGLFQNTNIFVISHKNTISDKFDSVIRFKKHKGFSGVDDG